MGRRPPAQPDHFGSNVNDSKFRLERVRAPISNGEIIADIRRVADLAGTNVISFRLYRELGNYDPTTAALRFGTWNGALGAAGLEIACERNITGERLFENLMGCPSRHARQKARSDPYQLSPAVCRSVECIQILRSTLTTFTDRLNFTW